MALTTRLGAIAGAACVVAACWAGGASRAHCATWSRILSTPGADYIAGLAPTSSGGFLGTGHVFAVPPTEAHLWLFELASDGSLVREASFEGPRTSDGGMSVVEAADGGLFVAGFVYLAAGDDDFWILRLDAQWNVLWQRTFGWGNYDPGYAIVATPDGGCVAAGSAQATGAYSDFFVIRLDAGGDILWERVTDGPLNGFARSLAATPDGGFMVAGDVALTTLIDPDAWLVKLDAQGSLEWEKRYGGISFDQANGLLALAEGGFVLAGATRSFGPVTGGLVVRVDDAGTVLWAKALECPVGCAFYGLARTDDGDFVLAGQTQADDPLGDVWVVGVDGAGNVKWQRAFGNAAGDIATSVLALPGGGVLLAGDTEPTGAASEEGWLLLLDAQGRLDPACGLGGDTAAVAYDVALVAELVGATLVATTTRTGATTTPPVSTGAVDILACASACGATAPPGEPSATGSSLPLRVVAKTSPAIRVERVPDATAYHVLVDRIGSWYGPSLATGTRCTLTTWSDEGDGSLTLDADMPAGSWAVVAASNCAGDSSAGRDSLGRERTATGRWMACPLGP